MRPAIFRDFIVIYKTENCCKIRYAGHDDALDHISFVFHSLRYFTTAGYAFKNASDRVEMQISHHKRRKGHFSNGDFRTQFN